MRYIFRTFILLIIILLINEKKIISNPFIDIGINNITKHNTVFKNNKTDSVFIDNNIFFLPHGQYYYTVSKKYNEINDFFIKEIIGGNIFVLFNWVKGIMFEKTNNCIKFKFDQNELYNSEISKKLVSLFDYWIGCMFSLIDNSIEINYEQFVSIDFNVSDKNTLFIHNVKGIKISNKVSMTDKIMGLLDVSRYKLLYHDGCVFLGVINPDKDEYFQYYVYTSLEDIASRGFAEVFKHSNQTIRTDLKPLVKLFF